MLIFHPLLLGVWRLGMTQYNEARHLRVGRHDLPVEADVRRQERRGLAQRRAGDPRGPVGSGQKVGHFVGLEESGIGLPSEADLQRALKRIWATRPRCPPPVPRTLGSTGAGPSDQPGAFSQGTG